MEAQIINIAIVDDHTLFRQGMVKLLKESETLNILFEAENGLDMINEITKNGAPDVILMDITMPKMDGYESSKWIKANYPEVKIIALSMFDDEKAILGMLRSGAGGYLIKHTKATELFHAINEINVNHFYFNELVSIKLLQSLQNQPTTPKNEKLNANELQFLNLCASDLTYKEIASQMNLSPFTINNYREALFDKFQVKSRTALVIYGLKKGYIHL
ncbi:response regulator transcription factor [Pedobacter alpinus]|uniref:Response regulator n=1 Tax=Pedobacter alpinus TaxID=1590643 RepID=A0ABW5TW16_9SPHI